MRTRRGAARQRGVRGIYFGWYILAGAAWMNGLGGSLLWQGFTVFFIPVATSLNLSAAQIALAFSLARAENGVLGPITGWALDKWGYRPLMFAGTMMTGIGYIWLSRMDTYLGFMLVYLLVVSIGSSTSFMQSTTAALNAWFVRMRGLVMSINSAAFRLGGAVMIPLLSYMVLAWGWQTAAFIIGIGMIVIVTPITLLFRRSPESIGLLPDGGVSLAMMRRRRAIERAQRQRSATKTGWLDSIINRRSSDEDSGDRVQEDAEETADPNDVGTKEALHSTSFWILVAATTMRITVHGSIFVHFIPILVWRGEDQQTAANLLGLLSLVAVPLILITGYLSDRIGRPLMLAFLYSMSAGSLFLLTRVEGTLPIFMAMLLFTGSEAGSSLNWAIIGDLFGRRRYATIRGMMAPIYNTALIIAPFTAGLVFDQTDSYELVLWIGTALMLCAGAVFAILQKPVMQRRGELNPRA